MFALSRSSRTPHSRSRIRVSDIARRVCDGEGPRITPRVDCAVAFGLGGVPYGAASLARPTILFWGFYPGCAPLARG